MRKKFNKTQSNTEYEYGHKLNFSNTCTGKNGSEKPFVKNITAIVDMTKIITTNIIVMYEVANNYRL